MKNWRMCQKMLNLTSQVRRLLETRKIPCLQVNFSRESNRMTEFSGRNFFWKNSQEKSRRTKRPKKDTKRPICHKTFIKNSHNRKKQKKTRVSKLLKSLSRKTWFLSHKCSKNQTRIWQPLKQSHQGGQKGLRLESLICLIFQEVSLTLRPTTPWMSCHANLDSLISIAAEELTILELLII